jgi:hypothetical protein
MACRMTPKERGTPGATSSGGYRDALGSQVRLRYRDRHGKRRQYLRRPGCKSIPLPGAWGSPEFMAAYQAAIATPAEPISNGSITAGSMHALAVKFFGSVEYANLKPSSQRTYRLVIETVCERCGDRPVKDMPREAAQKIILEIGARRKVMANLTTRVMRRVMEFAIDQGVRADNPFDRIKSYKIGTPHLDGRRTFRFREILGHRHARTSCLRGFALHWPTRQRRRGNAPSGRQDIDHRPNPKEDRPRNEDRHSRRARPQH